MLTYGENRMTNSVVILFISFMILAIQSIIAQTTLRLDTNVNNKDVYFQLGKFYLESQKVYDPEHLVRLISVHCQGYGVGIRETNQVMRHLLATWNMTLNEVAMYSTRNSSLERLSHYVNGCTFSPGLDDIQKEIIFNAALALWPWNVYASKNLAFTLEWEGYSHIARSLYKQTAQITGDIGSIFQGAFVSPPLLWSEEEAMLSHLQVLSGAHLLTTKIPIVHRHELIGMDPSLSVREFQLCWQYTGISPGVVSQVYGQALRHLFPLLSYVDPYVLKKRDLLVARDADGSHVNSKKMIRPLRVGIFSEHEANSSPGLCLMSILKALSKLTHRSRDNVDEKDFHFVYFRRPDSATVFNEIMEGLSEETVTLDPTPGNHEICREIIVALRLDILVFMALPTEKFTIFLSQARLATTQVQFGIGHPITSGSLAMDYSIVSRNMFLLDSSITRSSSINVTVCMEGALPCMQEMKARREDSLGGKYCTHMRQMGCITSFGVHGVTPPTSYTEQVVVFDSLGYFIDSPLTYYPSTRDFDPLKFAYESTCNVLDQKFQQWGLYPNITGRTTGCRLESNLPRTSRIAHLYSCIQNPKKMHPSFDAVLRRIIQRDPLAKILVEYRTPSLIPRWMHTLNLTEEQIYQRFVFVPRIEHSQYLQLISLTSVFLNTFPFGAGVTSSEAIALCIPVLVYAETSSVLHIALAQVRALGPRWIEEFVVVSLDDYAEKASRIAGLETMENPLGLHDYRQELCASRDLLLGPEPLAAAVLEWDRFLKNVAA